ncbi:hypothetical protein [Bradymonas sediminis]|uniref:Uncharacterized protein n=1 Tax=Bradymonas sediminis TaxID=1548548 RepID=A0A2Z4FPT4_9DELT|nr:hypothetical protein [Bradymonas sediminis]AWV90678.1 hypothetical protein DN745_15685 [Bradymonas sediminis]TDP62684.1 hypothetical protein DFR33_11290 [Bradymonas sediminis]
MKQDVIGAANLDIFALVALFLFVVAFIIIAIRAFTMSRQAVEEMQAMPMNDGTFVDVEEASNA